MRSATSSPESILRKGLKELSLTFGEDQIKAFMTYLTELKKWNKAYNLTSLKTDEDIVIKHFMDSLLYLEAIPEGEVSVMDVGSGAGFPGIPIKIIRPEIKMHLLEPSRKKASFLRHIIRTLRLDGIEVTEKRIEDVGSLMVDVAVTRALFDVREFTKKASPYVREGGRLVLSKGPRVNEELKAIKDTRYELLALTLPVAKIKRFIVVITKCSQKRETAERLHSAALNNTQTKSTDTCINAECRLRKAGCKGFEGCPGFKART
jgi:16S rRNA (guanine527-N7)-methyltransferase